MTESAIFGSNIFGIIILELKPIVMRPQSTGCGRKK